MLFHINKTRVVIHEYLLFASKQEHMLILERDLDFFSSPVGSELEAKFGCGTHCFGQSEASRE